MQIQPLISNELFRYFFRLNFKVDNGNISASNEELDEINKLFSEHLRNKCTLEQLNRFVPKSEIEVIMNKEHPLKMNGFDPAFCLHFTMFVEEERKKYNAIP